MKNDNIEDSFIHLNGEIAERKRIQARVKDAKMNGTDSELTREEDETLDELKARLAARAKTDEHSELVKSLRGTVSNFVRRRKRRPELMVKSLRHDERRLVLRKKVRG
jgi:uncharacterized protein with von Willebrand factor type A (vWA) domain